MAQRSKAKEAEAKGQARAASLSDLKSKKPLTTKVTLWSGDEPVEVVLQSIGRKRYADLVDKHSEEKETEKLDEDGEIVKDKSGEPVMEKREVLDEEAWFAELIAESIVEPEGVEVEDVLSFQDEWNAAEFDTLAMSALEVNTRHKVGQLGNA